MGPSEIRATVQSFWLNSLEAELLGCIALALAEILQSFQDIHRVAETLAISLGTPGRTDPCGRPGNS
jgi:hypothetical protein